MEVFEGNTADPQTVAAQVTKLRERFGLKQLVLVGVAMLTQARIREDLKTTVGLEWITALRPLRFRSWPMPAPCNSPYSTSKTWRKLPTPTTPASD